MLCHFSKQLGLSSIFRQFIYAQPAIASTIVGLSSGGVLHSTQIRRSASSGRMSTGRQKLVVDVDTGIDDAHALMLALANPAVEVKAVTCTNGNVKIDDVTANTLRVLQVCGRMDVPVYKGASRSLLGNVSTFDNFSGSAWSVPVDLGQLQKEDAANTLVRLANEYPGEITLVALAPLTNIAMALNLDPEFPDKLRDVVIMGGNADARGNVVSPRTEFNFSTDPEAAHVVLSSMKNIRLLPYEVCCHHNLSWEFMDIWTGAGTPKSNFLRDSLEFDVTTAKASGRKGYRSCDGYAMATVLDPTVVTEEEKAYATVELCGKLTRGKMVVDWSGVPDKEQNVSLITGLDLVKIQALFHDMALS